MFITCRPIGTDTVGEDTNGQQGYYSPAWFRFISRQLYELEFTPVVGASDYSILTFARDPFGFQVDSFNQLSTPSATADRCGALAFTLSNRSAEIDQGGSIQTAFIDGQILLDSNNNQNGLYEALSARTRDNGETKATQGAHVYWKPLRDADFELNPLSPFAMPAGSLMEESFIISVIHPSANSLTFRVEFTYVSEFRTSSQLFDQKCSPPLGIRPQLQCALLAMPAVTINDAHSSIFGRIFRKVKEFAVKAAKNPANWAKVGSLIASAV
jgi:hypothetical protein